MIKGLLEELLRAFELQTNRTVEQQPLPIPSKHSYGNDLVETLAKDPLNASLHLEYAIEASRTSSPYLAYAELKTAEYLGADRREIATLSEAFRSSLPDPLTMNHNQYFRFISLSSEIIGRADGT